MALAMLESGPPDRASLRRRDPAAGRRLLSSCGRLHRDGQWLDHLALPDCRVGTRHPGRAESPSSTPTPTSTPYDTGTFASTGTVVAGQAVEKTALAMRDVLIDFASREFRLRARRLPPARMTRSSAPTGKIPLAELHAAGAKVGDRFEVDARRICRRARSASMCRACASPCTASRVRS